MQTTRSLGSTLDRMLTLNRVLDQGLLGTWPTESRTWIPAIDLLERKEAYVLYVELPGVNQSDVELMFEQNVLTLRGVKDSTIDSARTGEVRVFATERATGAFERSIRLPDSIESGDITAEFSAGMLTVTIPKAKTARPRRIEIGSPVQTLGEHAESATQN